MNVAVVSLTRDRLAYTQHCFQTLQENAGWAYDHFVLDQGSTDGTAEWLLEQDDLDVTTVDENVGICPALNFLLDRVVPLEDYDVIVKIDNDCELLTPNTLAACAHAALEHDALVSPLIHGLRNRPAVIYRTNDLLVTGMIGGIFLAAPAQVFKDGYRHNERNPLWGGDDSDLCARWRNAGLLVGYLDGYDANHYLTTDGQHADNPGYFRRRELEGCPA